MLLRFFVGNTTTMNDDYHRMLREKELKNFVNEALKAGYWIYTPGTKTWDTPEEFMTRYREDRLTLNEGWVVNYKIMNPLKGSAAAAILVQAAIKRKQDFDIKIVEYFQDKYVK